MSRIEIAKLSDLTSIAGSVTALDGSLATVAKSGNYNDLTNKPAIPAKVTKTSELTNDSGFITASAIPAPPTVPTKLSELSNDTNFITLAQVPAPPSVPTKLSELSNDSGFITGVNGSQVPAVVDGLVATDVQGMIAELKALIDALGTP